MAITATYTAETVVLIVNQRTNSTRTTTFSNTEIDFATIAKPTNTNSAGTVTTSVVNDEGSTRFVAYPTTVIDYAPNITWEGTLSTTVSGTPTCSIAPTGALEIFPSHPIPPDGVQATGVNTTEDPRGLTYVALFDEAYVGNGITIQNLFPDLGVWNCSSFDRFPVPDIVQGPAVLETALYLTTTSTSTELGDHGPTLMDAPASRTPPILEPASKTSVITPSAASAKTFPTTPVAIPIPVTSTDSKGSITISTSTVIAHPIIISSTNAQGSVVLSTSLSTASVSASLPTIITSTDAQGASHTSTTHLPAIILTTTNAAGSEIITTSALSAFTPPASAPAPIVINDSETITPNAQSQYIISSQTLSPGGPPLTIGTGASTTVLALQASSGSTALVYGPSTSLLTSAAGGAAVLTIGTEKFTPNAHSQYLISGSTLVLGSPITLGPPGSSTVLALQTSGSQTALVYAASTSFLTPTPIPTRPPAITIGSETITANGQTQYLIGSQTLTPGGVVTVSGTAISLAAGESDVVIGGSTEKLAPYITAGFGSGANGTTAGGFVGGAEGGLGWGWRGIWLVGLVGMGFVGCL